MNRRLALGTLLLAVFLAGCRTSPIKNIDDSPVTTATGARPSVAEVRSAIVAAGSGLGWTFKDAASGHLVATLFLRSHMAMVDIRYSSKSYSITYKDSTDLKYDGTSIHSNYNGWIENLDNAIRARISAL